MRLQKYLNNPEPGLVIAEAKSTLYHSTFKRLLPKIKSKGITPQKKPSNTGRFGQDVRDDSKAIYAFNDKIEAYLWAFKLNWQMDKKNEVVVIVFRNTGDWEKDTHWEAQTARTKGSWIRSRTIVKPKDIKKIIPQDEIFETIKNMNMSGKL